MLDVNLPKFLSQDVPIFQQIVSDVFQSAAPDPDTSELVRAIDSTMIRAQLKPLPDFKTKVLQLYDTILSRHGLMLVGLPYAGKSTCARVLAAALGEMAKNGPTQPAASTTSAGSSGGAALVPAAVQNERAVRMVTINPKSMSIAQLYGYTERGSNEWQDGILAAKFRELSGANSQTVMTGVTGGLMEGSSLTASASTSLLGGKDVKDSSAPGPASNAPAAAGAPVRKWLHLDGPVDSLWVENMNTLLDDSKILCLTSGRVLHLTEGMNVIFEVRDLSAASPATVSRCGMVYMDPAQLGWK